MYPKSDIRQRSAVWLASPTIKAGVDAEQWVRSNDKYPYTCSLGGHSARGPHDGLLNSVTREKACQPCVSLLHDIAPTLVNCTDFNTEMRAPIMRTTNAPSPSTTHWPSRNSTLASFPRHATRQSAHAVRGCDSVARTQNHQPSSSTKTKRGQKSLKNCDKDRRYGHSASCYKQRAHAKRSLCGSSSRRNRRSRRSSGAHTDPKGRSQRSMRSARAILFRRNDGTMQGHHSMISDRSASKAVVSSHPTQTSRLEARIDTDAFLSKLESELLCKETSATCLSSSPCSNATRLSKRAPSSQCPTNHTNERGRDETRAVTEARPEDTSLCQSDVPSKGVKASSERQGLELRMQTLADEIWLLRSGLNRRR